MEDALDAHVTVAPRESRASAEQRYTVRVPTEGQGKAKLTSAALKVGVRIVAEGAQAKDTLTAATVQVGAAPAAAKK